MAPGIWTTYQGMLTYLEELIYTTKIGSGQIFYACLRNISKCKELTVGISHTR